MTLTEQLDRLQVQEMTLKEIRLAALTASVCGDQALAAALRQAHDARASKHGF